MSKEIVSRPNIFKSFLDQFVAKGIENIPYDFHKMHEAFYEVLNKDSDLATQWELLKRTNPSCGGLDRMIEWFQRCGVISFDDSSYPTHIAIDDISRYREKSSERETEIASKLYDNYSKLVA